MFEKIAVVGTGAIGSSLAADFTRAGLDVTLVDQWPAHVEAMRREGARIGFPSGELQIPVDALHLCDLASANRTFDLVFLASKAYDTAWLATLIRPYLAEDGVVVVIQNGMTNTIVADVVGRERTIGSVVELSAEIFEPPYVQRDTERDGTWFALGELDGSTTPRLEAARDVLANTAKVDLTDNIEGAKWTKLIANSMTMGPFGLFGLKNWEAVRLPGMFDISVAIGRESLAVGTAQGLRLEPIFGLTPEEFAGSSDEILVKAMETLMQHVGPESSTAPVHDHKKGRRSEMSFITGEVVRRGADLGIPTPYNAAVLEIDHRINTAQIPMEVANLDLLRSLATTPGGSR